MKKILASVLVSAFPLMAFAQNYTPSQGVFGLMAMLKSLLNYALPIIISLAVVWFIFEVFMFAIAGDEEKKKKAKEQMIYGIVAIFVMVSIWGLVGILQSTFGTGNGTAVIGNPLPQ